MSVKGQTVDTIRTARQLTELSKKEGHKLDWEAALKIAVEVERNEILRLCFGTTGESDPITGLEAVAKAIKNR